MKLPCRLETGGFGGTVCPPAFTDAIEHPGWLSVACGRVDDNVGNAASRIGRLVPGGTALMVGDSTHHHRGTCAGKGVEGRCGYGCANGIGRCGSHSPDRCCSPVAIPVAVPVVIMPVFSIILPVFTGFAAVILPLALSLSALLLSAMISLKDCLSNSMTPF